ncbi:hypothetical protein SDC9_115804 [bioreactor metagenome]|uniref:Uncharacterized protein n=1 Tax=bioreactor metagenome TaxID=1076179 RepID=A0A645BTX2_9ZZZZ
MRKCKANIYKNREKTTVFGLFHCWGSEFEEFENGPGNYTVAIIEMSDGTIKTAGPSELQFLPDSFSMPGWGEEDD